MKRSYETAIVSLLGYLGMGKRTVGGALATLIEAVLLDNARIHGVLLEPFRWDGVAPLPTEIWDRVTPVRLALLGVIEDLAPASNSYVFTNALEDEESSAEHYDSIKSLAARRGSLFWPSSLTATSTCRSGASTIRTASRCARGRTRPVTAGTART